MTIYCDFYVHPTYSYAGESPDGKIRGSEPLVEIKCLGSLTGPLTRHKTLQECIREKHKVLRFWKHGVKHMDSNHAYFYQMQGQLEVTNVYSSRNPNKFTQNRLLERGGHLPSPWLPAGLDARRRPNSG